MRRSIRIYGKEGCERCTKAKEKMELLGLHYEYHELSEILDEKNGKWRERVAEAIALKAETCMDNSMPIIWIKEHGYLRYGAALKIAKGLGKRRKK